MSVSTIVGQKLSNFIFRKPLKLKKSNQSKSKKCSIIYW